MYNSTYDDYIRSILGYPNIQNTNTQNEYDTIYQETYMQNTRNDLEQFYPEIYKIIYPMIKKACNENMRANTGEEIDRLTDEIYSAIEDNNQINININLENPVDTNRNSEEKIGANKIENRNTKIPNNKMDRSVDKREETSQNRETRAFRNNNLRDLIKILLIRELLGRPGNRPSIRPPRPPFPGPGPGPRPPIMPRSYEIPYYDIYEN